MLYTCSNRTQKCVTVAWDYLPCILTVKYNDNSWILNAVCWFDWHMRSRTASGWQKCILRVKNIAGIKLKLKTLWCIVLVSSKSSYIIFNKISCKIKREETDWFITILWINKEREWLFTKLYWARFMLTTCFSVFIIYKETFLQTRRV
jgi:hypothetical protein